MIQPTGNTETARSVSLTPTMLLGAGVVLQLLSLRPLWGHQSDVGEFLSRYSYRYGAALILSIALLVGWLLLFLCRRKLDNWLVRLPHRWHYAFILVTGAAVFAVWLTGVEAIVQHYLALNWLLLTLFLVRRLPDHPVNFRWTWAVGACVAVLLVPMFLTALAGRSFSPDEAQWADLSTSYYVAGGLYNRTWLQQPVLVLPGVGWSLAAYGWVLEHVAFDIKVGRVWNFAFFLLAFAGIGAVTARLYGRQAAVASISFAALSQVFIPTLDYRPDHQLPAAAMLVAWTALQARNSTKASVSSLLHFACGLFATLSLQLHAAGIVFAFGFSLFYAIEFIWNSFRQRRLASARPIIWFALGAMLGTALYYLLNIQPVGGLAAYLQMLVASRGQFKLTNIFLYWPWFFEAMLILGGIAFLLWRRAPQDRLLLGMLGCVLVGIALLDTQGYLSHYSAFYMVPIGALLIDGFQTARIARGQNIHCVAVVACVLWMMIGQSTGGYIAWPTVGAWLETGHLPPFLYEELRPILDPYVQEDDVVVSTHQLIWTIPDHPGLLSVSAEPTGMKRWRLSDGAQVWEQVKPTLIINVENQMELGPRLEQYMVEHQFVVCRSLFLLGTKIEIYRVDCPSA